MTPLLCAAVFIYQSMHPIASPENKTVLSWSQGVAATPLTTGQYLDQSDLHAIAEGLVDIRLEVRLDAAAALSRAIAALPLSSAAEQLTERRRLRPTLMAAMIHALSDTDFRVRAVAIKGIAMLANIGNATVRESLIARYSVETDEGVRTVIVSELGNRAIAYEDVRELLLRAMSDRHAWVRRAAAPGLAVFHPLSALSGVVNELVTGELDTRHAFVDLLVSYGPNALPYVSVLERILSIEASELERLHIDMAIRQIRTARQSTPAR